MRKHSFFDPAGSHVTGGCRTLAAPLLRGSVERASGDSDGAGPGEGGVGEGVKYAAREGNWTVGGEHAGACRDAESESRPPGNYIVLLTNVTPIN